MAGDYEASESTSGWRSGRNVSLILNLVIWVFKVVVWRAYGEFMVLNGASTDYSLAQTPPASYTYECTRESCQFDDVIHQKIWPCVRLGPCTLTLSLPSTSGRVTV